MLEIKIFNNFKYLMSLTRQVRRGNFDNLISCTVCISWFLVLKTRNKFWDVDSLVGILRMGLWAPLNPGCKSHSLNLFWCVHISISLIFIHTYWIVAVAPSDLRVLFIVKSLLYFSISPRTLGIIKFIIHLIWFIIYYNLLT